MKNAARRASALFGACGGSLELSQQEWEQEVLPWLGQQYSAQLSGVANTRSLGVDEHALFLPRYSDRRCSLVIDYTGGAKPAYHLMVGNVQNPP